MIIHLSNASLGGLVLALEGLLKRTLTIGSSLTAVRQGALTAVRQGEKVPSTDIFDLCYTW